MPVVVVESPAKAKTINAYLGRRLHASWPASAMSATCPAKDGSVDPEHGLRHEVGGRGRLASKHLKAIADALKDDPNLILATDPDREGEAISWHLHRGAARPQGDQGSDRSAASPSTPSPRPP